MDTRYWVMTRDAAAEYGDSRGYSIKSDAAKAAADMINDGYDEDDVLVIEGREVEFNVIRDTVRVEF